MGNELKTGTRENHERTKVRSDYKLNYPNNGGISPAKWHSCWVYGPYLFILPTTGRPTRASNREINQKLLTLLGQPACLTVLHGNWRTGCSLGFFMHREPIRSCHLGSRDLHVGFQSSDARASKMAGMPTQFEVLPSLEEWHINLEVGSQVYQLLQATSESDPMA